MTKHKKAPLLKSPSVLQHRRLDRFGCTVVCHQWIHWSSKRGNKMLCLMNNCHIPLFLWFNLSVESLNRITTTFHHWSVGFAGQDGSDSGFNVPQAEGGDHHQQQGKHYLGFHDFILMIIFWCFIKYDLNWRSNLIGWQKRSNIIVSASNI